jgi:hypothetical protein
MKKLFIIGTGRNGSKLTGRIISTAVNRSNMFGEIHNNLFPIFFKDAHHGKVSTNEVIKIFKNSRDQAMRNLKEIYVEKNHLVVPILECVKKAYPDALFLYVKRNPRDIIRSLFARGHYSSTDKGNIYAEGRLTPNNEDLYNSDWSRFSSFEKVCWYVKKMTEMCEKFLDKLPKSDYNVISYEEIVENPSVLKGVFEWIGLNFDLEAIKGILGKQWGSSARSPKEVNFKIVDEKKFKRTPHWKKWSDEQKEIYRRFFGDE